MLNSLQQNSDPPLVADRKDFVALDTRCARLDAKNRIHGFPSHTAYILVDRAGKEHAYGSTCVHLLGFPVDLHGIPDFTVRDAAVPLGGGHEGGSGPRDDSDRTIEASVRDLALAKRYLLLRMEKVANIAGIDGGVRYEPLENIYRQYQQTRGLDAASVARIIAVDRSDKTPDRYRTNNLLDVYTADVQLGREIERAKTDSRKEFLSSIRTFLRSRLKLSPLQIEKAKLKLHRSAFAG